ncbi:hypothetical protein FDG2_1275 [Candidatus Protofrankia californiensis]|uniref:Uncharacterized protein n=2 Tax=Protofrankia TaxID=2994361 RepID=A0A1C3NVE1_9ACTN|nr:hypothetical protein FDG2_1275 [Candidatus Protofrankia californiensis]
MIDGAPALAHAVRVVVVLGQHHPTAPPALLAAVLLHDAPELAPSDQLDPVVMSLLGPETLRIIRVLEAEHRAMATPNISGEQTLDRVRRLASDDMPSLLATTADKIVAFGSVLRRAARVSDPDVFWQARRPFRDQMPYFHAFRTAAAPFLPRSMACELTGLLVAADRACRGLPHTRTVPQHPTHRKDQPWPTPAT